MTNPCFNIMIYCNVEVFNLFIDICESKSYCLFIDMKITRVIYSMIGELK